jgi:hypothetical protein
MGVLRMFNQLKYLAGETPENELDLGELPV